MPEILCEVSDHTYVFWGGTIEITRAKHGCVARFIWDDDYGEREIEEGPAPFVMARVFQILRRGPTFGPLHRHGEDGLRWKEFASDMSERATRPHGEVRIKPFLGQFALFFVPDGGFRPIAVSKDLEMLQGMATTYGARWATLGAPRLAVRFEGKHRELQVSNFAGELAYVEVDDHTAFSLVPHSLPEGDRPAMAALYLVRDEDAELLSVLPIDPTADEVVIWSDERRVSSTSTSFAVQPSSTSAAASAGADDVPSPLRTPDVAAVATGPLHPTVRVLLDRYLAWFAAQPGFAKDLREEISPHIVLGAERGANVAGWGSALQRGLERACNFKSSAGRRTFCYFVRALRRDGILVRPGTNPRKSEFVFAELRRLDSPAVAQLCAWAGVTVESLEARVQVAESAVASRVHATKPAPSSPPPGRTPPMTPPTSQPSGRESSPRVASVAPPGPELDTSPSRGEETPRPSSDGQDPGSPGSTTASAPPDVPPPLLSDPASREQGITNAVFNGPLRILANEQLANLGMKPEGSPPAGEGPRPRIRSRPIDPMGFGVLEPEFLFLDPQILRTFDDDDDDLPGGGSGRGPPDET